MGDPRTTREALIAQMLGELDELLTRAERLPRTVAEAERQVAATTRILVEAGDKYRQAITAFTEEAKTLLTDYLQYKAVETAASAANAQCATLEEAVRQVLDAEVALRVAQLESHMQLATESRHARRVRLLEHGITALFASVLTTLLSSSAQLI